MTMQAVDHQVKQLFVEALRGFGSPEPMVMKGNPKYGDYQCNNAMGLFKEHGKSLGFANPGALAEQIKAAIPPNDMFEEVTVAPQGFITVKLSKDFVQSQVQKLLLGPLQWVDAPQKRVVVDFSSPNIAKEMHVGHLRSTIIGESTCRLLEFGGHVVFRLNHVGDWGTQFGMLIEYMKEVYPSFQEHVPDVGDLQAFYKAAKKRFDEDEEFKERSRATVVALQSGDPSARLAWQKICDVSRLHFNKIYQRLDITLEERGESFYNDMIAPLVVELEEKGLCVESDGAKCVFTPGVADIPLMVVKSDGGYGYDSTDVAAIHHRLCVMKADWLIYITDMGQEQHFFMVFDAAKRAGWHTPPTTRCDHMGFGVVQGDDGKKFKTRSGEVVKLADLLDEAVDRAKQEITARVAEQQAREGDSRLESPEEQQEAAEKLGIAAVRYFDMKLNRQTAYVFDYDKMLDPKGNSAVFLFYTYARLRAIQRKAGVDVLSLPPEQLQIVLREERDLALKLLQFPDTLQAVLANLHLHQLTDYLWELCNTLTAFYMKCKVVGEPEQNSRLLLCEATRKVLEKSFFILGFSPLEKI